MTEQVVRIQKDDVASVAYKMAEALWFEEFKAHPKASEARFMGLVAICTRVLLGRLAPAPAQKEISSLFTS